MIRDAVTRAERKRRAAPIVVAEPEQAVLPDGPGIARLWPELAGVPWDRVVDRAVAERPYVGAVHVGW